MSFYKKAVVWLGLNEEYPDSAESAYGHAAEGGGKYRLATQSMPRPNDGSVQIVKLVECLSAPDLVHNKLPLGQGSNPSRKTRSHTMQRETARKEPFAQSRWTKEST